MKSFLIKCICFALLIAVCIIPFNIVTDPYNVFHTERIRDNGVEPNKNYIKTKYIIENPDKFDSYLFGSSRVGFLDVEKMTGGTYYDMMYSEGLPKEHLHSIQNLLANGEIPKNVIIGVDDISYLVDPEWHTGQLYRLEYPFQGSLLDKASFFIRYLDTITTLQSLSTMKAYGEENLDNVERFYKTGTEHLTYKADFQEEWNIPYWADYYSPRLNEVIEEISEIVALCEDNQINLIFFTNPIHETTYTQDIEFGYISFLEALAEVTPYYNFSGFNDITTNNDYYYETSHYKSPAGDLMINAIFHNQVTDLLKEQGFGTYVTAENKDEFITLIKSQADARNISYPVYK